MNDESSSADNRQSVGVGHSNPHPRLRRILHPTDFSSESHAAFAHALKLAVAAQAQLDIVHIEPDPQSSDLDRFPSVRETLIRWGVLPHGASQHEVASLGITVQKLSLRAESPGVGVLQFLAHHDEDLIVMSTHQRHGIDRWFHPEIATRVARRSHVSTLFIPADGSGFVNRDDGSSPLKRVVLPVNDVPSPQRAIDLAAELVRLLGQSQAVSTFSVMHVGPQPITRPDLRYPDDAGWQWEWMARSEDVVDDIIEVAEQKSADLIAMSTEGHTCWKDILSGCTTENVAQKAPCPVLAVYEIGTAAVHAPARTISESETTAEPRVAAG